jgi:hypothetical protein
MLVNILFGIIILLLIVIVVYIHRREKLINDMLLLLGYYSMRFGEFTPEQISDWLIKNVDIEEED